MRHILVTNAKGGCGKSTIATSLAAYFASEGYATAIADFDPQRSALSWLEQRPADYAPIAAVPAYESGLTKVPRNTEFLVIDSPAGSYGKDLIELVRKAETIIGPVLPSPIDIKAADRFVEEQLFEEDDFSNSCRINGDIADLASRINDLNIWFRTQQDLDKESKRHSG